MNLLQRAKDGITWRQKTGEEGKKYLQVSTDEAYGALGAKDYFTETTRCLPTTPILSPKPVLIYLPWRSMMPMVCQSISHAAPKTTALPIPGEVDPTDDQQRQTSQEVAGLRLTECKSVTGCMWRIIARPLIWSPMAVRSTRSTTWVATMNAQTSLLSQDHY